MDKSNRTFTQEQLDTIRAAMLQGEIESMMDDNYDFITDVIKNGYPAFPKSYRGLLGYALSCVSQVNPITHEWLRPDDDHTGARWMHDGQDMDDPITYATAGRAAKAYMAYVLELEESPDASVLDQSLPGESPDA